MDWIVIDVDAQWTSKETEILATIIKRLHDSFRALIVFSVTGRDKLAQVREGVGSTLPQEWNWVSYRMDATFYGDPIETDVGVCVLSPFSEKLSKMTPEHRAPLCLQDVLSSEIREHTQVVDRGDDIIQGSAAISSTAPTSCDLLPMSELPTHPSYKLLSERKAQPVYFVRDENRQVPYQSFHRKDQHRH